ncbi:hypothetical protein POM88_018109 [Heracleum sosnowskyi]|uniref:Uncharacterized protein n=1 Tax=Heracleum sosnowskyi TaxID=360622 RepID=A0AAD8IQR1_9APIA|nr:hypothetical protein POM88_018109 [Heracleum sosnowskyi]
MVARGRYSSITDNAVKNRFSTLCKKKAKREALAKQTTTTYVNLNNKRVISRLDTNEDESSETGVLHKKTRRDDSSDLIETSPEEFREIDEQVTPPFSVMVQDFNILRDLETQAFRFKKREQIFFPAAAADAIDLWKVDGCEGLVLSLCV